MKTFWMSGIRSFLAFTLGVMPLLPYKALSNESQIAVIYPEVRAPFVAIFKEIITGIDQATPTSILEFSLPDDKNVAGIKKVLDERKISTVITLGSSGLRFSKDFNGERNVISGAAISYPLKCPPKVSCLSMLPAPNRMLEQLVQLVPTTKTVHVVYNQKRDQWLIDIAETSAKQLGISLNAIPAGKVRENAKFYKEILNHKLNRSDALWLLQGDPALKDRNLIGSLLEEAWRSDFVVFSSNPAHVKKGALFAMYPDNSRLGFSLGKKAIELASGGERSIEPLSDLFLAVNLRTADHLQLDITREQESSFNLIFPTR